MLFVMEASSERVERLRRAGRASGGATVLLRAAAAALCLLDGPGSDSKERARPAPPGLKCCRPAAWSCCFSLASTEALVSSSCPISSPSSSRAPCDHSTQARAPLPLAGSGGAASGAEARGGEASPPCVSRRTRATSFSARRSALRASCIARLCRFKCS